MRLHGLKLLSRNRVFSKQPLQAFGISGVLIAQGNGLVEPGLGFSGIELGQQVTGLDRLARHYQHFLDPAADLRLKHRLQLGSDCADHFLGRNLRFLTDSLDMDSGGGSCLSERSLRLVAAPCEEPQGGNCEQKR